MLGAAAYNHWIDYDAAVCHFTDEDFLAFLAFFKTLPENVTEIKNRYPFSDQLYGGTSHAEGTEPYRKGQVALFTGYVGNLNDLLFDLDICFGTLGTDDLVYIGCPSSDGKPNNVVASENSFLITKSCSDPAKAWDVIRFLFEPTEDELTHFQTSYLPSLKSTFEQITERMKNNVTAIDMTNMSAETFTGMEPENTDENTMLVRMDEAKRESMRNYLETVGGARVIDSTPDGINAIIAEEIDEMLAKGTSEESCAKNIQSRVSIWLAEHK